MVHVNALHAGSAGSEQTSETIVVSPLAHSLPSSIAEDKLRKVKAKDYQILHPLFVVAANFEDGATDFL